MLDQFKLLVLAQSVISDLYLFHLRFLLSPVFNCSNDLLSSSVDIVTNGTYNLVSVILYFKFVGLQISATAGSYQGQHLLLLCLLLHNFQTRLKQELFHN